MNDNSKSSMRSRVIMTVAAVAIVAAGITVTALRGRYLVGRGARTGHVEEVRAVSGGAVETQAHGGKPNEEPLHESTQVNATEARKSALRRVSIARETALTFREGFEKSKASDLRIDIESDAGPAPRRSYHLTIEVIMGKRAELQRDLHSPKYEEFSFVPVNFEGVMEPLLDIAIEADRPRIAQMLIADGANVNGVAFGANAWTMTPLAWAAHLHNAKIAKLLIEHGANIDGRGPPTRQRGRQPTPLGEALSVQSPNVALLLLKHGASLRKALGPGMMIPNWIAYPTAHGYREGAADTTRIDRLRSLLVSEGATLPPRNGGQ
ncbi:MAG: ankyrin repeat domain-containing protein [Pseudomonadota bacterium]|jgi:hypothetical protein|nr:ankyrin repeat domain-containing protein [Pseudomonadota bacterium]